jgi:cytochrome c biogenesis factor
MKWNHKKLFTFITMSSFAVLTASAQASTVTPAAKAPVKKVKVSNTGKIVGGTLGTVVGVGVGVGIAAKTIAAKQLSAQANELGISTDRLQALNKNGFSFEDLKSLKSEASDIDLNTATTTTLKDYQSYRQIKSKYDDAVASQDNDKLSNLEEELNDARDTLTDSIKTDSLVTNAQDLGISPGTLQDFNNAGFSYEELKNLVAKNWLTTADLAKGPVSAKAVLATNKQYDDLFGDADEAEELGITVDKLKELKAAGFTSEEIKGMDAGLRNTAGTKDLVARYPKQEEAPSGGGDLGDEAEDILLDGE